MLIRVELVWSCNSLVLQPRAKSEVMVLEGQDGKANNNLRSRISSGWKLLSASVGPVQSPVRLSIDPEAFLGRRVAKL